MAKKQDYSKNTKQELLKLAQDKREELRALRFGGAGSKNRDVKQVAKLRKEVARALTAANRSTPLTAGKAK